MILFLPLVFRPEEARQVEQKGSKGWSQCKFNVIIIFRVLVNIFLP